MHIGFFEDRLKIDRSLWGSEVAIRIAVDPSVKRRLDGINATVELGGLFRQGVSNFAGFGTFLRDDHRTLVQRSLPLSHLVLPTSCSFTCLRLMRPRW